MSFKLLKPGTILLWKSQIIKDVQIQITGYAEHGTLYKVKALDSKQKIRIMWGYLSSWSTEEIERYLSDGRMKILKTGPNGFLKALMKWKELGV